MNNLLNILITEIKESHEVPLVVEWCEEFIRNYYKNNEYFESMLVFYKKNQVKCSEKHEILNICINLFYFGYDITNNICYNKYTDLDERSIHVVGSMVCWAAIGNILRKNFNDVLYLQLTEIFDDAGLYLNLPNNRNICLNFHMSKLRLNFYTKVYLPLKIKDALNCENNGNNYNKYENIFCFSYLNKEFRLKNLKKEELFDNFSEYLKFFSEDIDLGIIMDKIISGLYIRELELPEIKIHLKTWKNRPDIFILATKTLVDVGITSQDSLQIIKIEIP
ncbi:hypothetical protein CWI38_0352p0050 [Hamiltosporidium tvaerminnensis]|uniref:Uncharacterized protein n=1 Tax=Hamiltosporidium tvaerminnensis TaxID=1176355 RepID=A0A4Q9LY91_9MICR|nr:hypothetical protein CWI38_0352p0050 [Hamiltosporidium tvaerminnensis]